MLTWSYTIRRAPSFNELQALTTVPSAKNALSMLELRCWHICEVTLNSIPTEIQSYGQVTSTGQFSRYV